MQINLQTMAFQAKLLSHMFFKVIQYGHETFQNFAPILHFVICSEMNTASIINKRQATVMSFKLLGIYK